VLILILYIYIFIYPFSRYNSFSAGSSSVLQDTKRFFFGRRWSQFRKTWYVRGCV